MRLQWEMALGSYQGKNTFLAQYLQTILNRNIFNSQFCVEHLGNLGPSGYTNLMNVTNVLKDEMERYKPQKIRFLSSIKTMPTFLKMVNTQNVTCTFHFYSEESIGSQDYRNKAGLCAINLLIVLFCARFSFLKWFAGVCVANNIRLKEFPFIAQRPFTPWE